MQVERSEVMGHEVAHTFTLETKLGTTRSGPRSRIWLQGARLLSYGFPPGSKFRKSWGKGKLTLTGLTFEEYEDTPRAERASVCGDMHRPVIDIIGAAVSSTFTGKVVCATFSMGRIVITDKR